MDKDIDYFEKVRRSAYTYLKTLPYSDPRFRRSVCITHFDGVEVLDNAFLMVHRGSVNTPACIVILSQHYGVRVYPRSGLRDWAQYTRIEDEEASFDIDP